MFVCLFVCLMWWAGISCRDQLLLLGKQVHNWVILGWNYLEVWRIKLTNTDFKGTLLSSTFSYLVPCTSYRDRYYIVMIS